MSGTQLRRFETIRTTVSLPVDLVLWSQYYVDQGIVPSRNALIVAAIEQFLATLEREEIDRQFAAMADDPESQALALELAEEFAESDWEALLVGEEVAT